MNQSDYSGQRVAVVGYGVEGQSSANFFYHAGAEVAVFDAHEVDSQLPTVQRDLSRGIAFHWTESTFGQLSDFDLIIRTPSLSPYHPALQRLDQAKITSQTQLFLGRWRHRCVGVTGTKGKGTTSSLLHHLLQSAGQKSLLGGNIGVPMLDLFDQMDEQTVAILELSSYQLWDVKMSPATAVMLMVAPEHLDVHLDEGDYIAAKRRILEFQHANDLAIVNQDYPISRESASMVRANLWSISDQPVERGAQIRGNEIWLHLDHQPARLCQLSDTRLQGRHNLENIAAAALVARHLDVSVSTIKAALPNYQPLPHRLELVATRGEIDYIDDSIATNPDAARAALRSFDRPVVLILGGVHPTAVWQEAVQDFTTSDSLAGIVLIGQTSLLLKELLTAGNLTIPVLTETSIYSAVMAATGILEASHQPGVVLLSPGAKSFDMFQDYQDRGQQFKLAVERLT